jgi:2-succinyl-5-enolpyruvyl-6-hydroxy-3-cyclohexene-1-carboxylate synthase
MSGDTGYRLARRFVHGLAECGAEVVAVGAGSRSTGAALAFHDDGRFKVHSFVDERSAAFFALGAARATGRPAAVLTTSGTAAANLLPAAVEARAAGVPLVLLTADRPPEMHDVGAMQTVEQIGLLPAAIWTVDLHTYDDAMISHAAHLAAQACAFATGTPPGPVHVNMRFREPFVPSAEIREENFEQPSVVCRPSSVCAPDPTTVTSVAARMRAKPRGLIYAGHMEGDVSGLAAAVEGLAIASGFPVIAEATSRLRGRLGGAIVVDAAEALIRAAKFADWYKPDFVLRIGRAPLTRGMLEWLGSLDADQVVVAPGVPWADPTLSAKEVLASDETEACTALSVALGGSMSDGGWADAWAASSVAARTALDSSLDSGAFFEGTVTRGVVRNLPEGALLFTASSLSIRALDAFTPATAPLEAFASRGASGIDGTTSAALGAAVATGRPVVCLTGDLAFLHDIGGLAAAARHLIPLVTVVIDNGGGGLFDFLPQRKSIDRDTFEDLFATSHTLDLLHAAELFGLQFASVHDADELDRVLKWAFTEGTAWVIRAEVRRGASVEAHGGAWAAVVDAL